MSLLRKSIVYALVATITLAAAQTTVPSVVDDLTTAQSIRDRVPRFFSSSDNFTDLVGSDSNEDTRTDYVIGVGSTGIYGAILVVAAIGSLCCVCGWCRCLSNESTSLSRKSKIAIVCGFMILCILTLGFTAAGYNYNRRITQATVDADTGVLSIVKNLMNDGLDFFESISNQVNEILDDISNSVDFIIEVLSNAPAIVQNGVNDIIDELEGISVVLRENTTISGMECQTCLEIADTIDGIVEELNDDVSPAIDDIVSSIDEVNEFLVDNSETITSGVEDALETLSETVDFFESDFEPVFDSVDAEWRRGEKIRNSFMIVLFLMPISVFLIALIGICSRSRRVFKINSCFLWCSWFWMAICLAIHLPIAVILSDSCVYLDDQEDSVSGDVAIAFDVCINGGSLSEQLNLNESLSFRDDINIAEFSNEDLNDTVVIPELYEFQESVNSLTISDFGGNSSAIDDLLVEFSTDTTFSSGTVTYTRENISTADPSEGSDPDASEQLQTTIETLIEVETQAESVIEELQIRTNSLVSLYEGIAQNITDLNVELLNLSNAVIDPLFDSVDALIDSVDCVFIGEAYTNAKTSTCSTLISGLSGLSLFLTLIIFVSMFALCLNNQASKLVIEDEYIQQKLEMEHFYSTNKSTGFEG